MKARTTKKNDSHLSPSPFSRRDSAHFFSAAKSSYYGNEKGVIHTFSTNASPDIQRAMLEQDPIHDSLLDQYSRETGLSRDSVSQHDPNYEQWLVPINITLDMYTPATNPRPDYTQSENQLGAWEQANFRFSSQIINNCESITTNGIEVSYVKDVGIRFTRSIFEFFVAQHIQQNMNNRANLSASITWRQINSRILNHSREHFSRYRHTLSTMREIFHRRLSNLPNRFNPAPISRQQLQSHVGDLLRYFISRLRFELWQTTCEWERTDYPTLLRGIQGISGRFVPNCGTAPTILPNPILPTRVTSTESSQNDT